MDSERKNDRKLQKHRQAKTERVKDYCTKTYICKIEISCVCWEAWDEG